MKKTTDEILDLLETAKTKGEKIKHLNELVDIELEKNNVDWNLIDECNEFLGELDSTDFTHEELLAKLSELIKTAPKKKRKKLKKIILRFVAATMAFTIISVTVITVVAKSNGYESVWDFISQM